MDFLNKLKSGLWNFFHAEEAINKRMMRGSGMALDPSSVSFSGTKRMLHGLTNAVLMFFFIAGTNAALADAFSIEYNSIFLFTVYALFSLMFSLMNCKKLWQNMGYILFFVLYTFFLITYRQFINSGLNGFLNDFFEYASDAWHMDVTKTYNEAFEAQHYMTVTMFFMTVGLAIMLLINFIFNNEKSPLTVLVVLFPFLQMGIFFDEIPGTFSFILIATGLLCCFVMRHNYQFIMPMAKKESTRHHGKKNHMFMHYSNGTVVLQLLGVILSFMLVFSILASVLYPADSYTAPKNLTGLKEQTQETVKQVLLYGFQSLFGDGESGGNGGLNSGALGNVGTVTSDFQTDLIVTFAPYAYETVYLKSSVYTTYVGRHWISAFNEPVNIQDRDISDDCMNAEATALSELFQNDSRVLKGKMIVKPEDPFMALNYFASPYYTLYDTEEYNSEAYYYTRMPYYTGTSYEKEFTYYVYQDIWNSDIPEQPVTTSYDRFVHENYLSVYGTIGGSSVNVVSTYLGNPEDDSADVTGQLKALCEEQGFGGTTQEIIKQLQDYFKENFTYSLNPGKTPEGKDFVTYFLFENPYGYCSYFATAGTLLLRSMGIPARYVEGYVISMSDVVESTILEDEDYDEWLQGEALIGKTAVVEAEIDDSRAHAWCEVYLNGFGWVPVEFTPPSSDNEEEDTDYWRLWEKLGNVGASEDNANILANIMGTGISKTLAAVIKVILILSILAGAVIFIRAAKKKWDLSQGKIPMYEGFSVSILKKYQKLCQRLVKKKLTDTDNLPPSQTESILSGIIDTRRLSQIELKEMMDIYRDAAYGSEPVSREIYRKWQELYRKLIKSIR